MANADINIKLNMKDNASRKMKGFATVAKQSLLAVTAIAATAGLAFQRMAASLIGTASEVEQMETKLRVLLGTAREGNKVFKDMATLAGKVPKTYQEIMQASTTLAGVVKNGSQEINDLMPIILDISAATGLSVQDVTSQMVRMYSAGAASADMFRERGILTALGFEAGVKTSAASTMKFLIDQWKDGTGKFVGATEELANTWEGQVSMMQDTWFTFKQDVGQNLFEEVKLDMRAVLEVIKQSKEEGGEYAAVVGDISAGFDEAFNTARKFVGIIAIGIGQAIDGFNNFKAVITEVQEKMAYLTMKFQEARQAVQGLFASEETKERLAETVEMARFFHAEMVRLSDEANAKSNEDYSEAIETRLNAFMAATEREREILQEREKVAIESGAKEIALAAKIAAQKKKLVETERKARAVAVVDNMKQTMTTSTSMLSMLSQTFAMAQGETKKFAGVLKVIRIGETIINTASAMMRAMAEISYPINTGIAAAIGAMGAAQVGIIASQGFAEGTDTVPAMLSPGEMVIPRTFADSIRSGDIAISGRGGANTGGGSVASPVLTNNTFNMEFINTSVRNDDDIDGIVEAVSRRLADEVGRIQ